MMLATAKDPRAHALLPIVMLTVGINFVQNSLCRPEGAVFHQILYVEQGNGILETAEGNFELPEGIAVFMRKDAPVKYYGKSEIFNTAWVSFVGSSVDQMLSYVGAKNFAFLQSKSIYSMIVNAYKLAERGSAQELLSKCAYEVLISFFHELNTVHQSPMLIKAKNYIEENFKKDISVSDVARFLGVSESSLFRLFRDYERQTPSDYLKAIRMRSASQLLLAETEMKISELAHRCGFFDTAYFCKVFKKEMGMTPKTYRSRFQQ